MTRKYLSSARQRRRQLEQPTAVTAARKEETVDSKGQEFSALIERRKMDRKDKAQVGDISKNMKQGICKSGKQHKSCSSALCTMDDASSFLVIRLGPKTSECHENVIVVSTVTVCDVTNCATTLHGFSKLASSRHEAVSDSRGVPRCTWKIHKMNACSHVSIIRLVHFTIRSACNSSSSLVSVMPVARRTRLAQLCPHTQHRSQFVDSFTSQRFRPDVARVHISLDW